MKNIKRNAKNKFHSVSTVTLLIIVAASIVVGTVMTKLFL